MQLYRLAISLVLATSGLAHAQVGVPDVGGFQGGFNRQLTRQKEFGNVQSGIQIGRIEQSNRSLNADQMEERLARLSPEGVNQTVARNKLLEAIKQAKRDCPACMTVLEAEAGSLGVVPGTMGRCKAVSTCSSIRPFLNSATGLCMSVAEIKALP